MILEVELKYSVGNLQEIERALAQLGVVLGDPLVQVDRYYGHPARDFAATDEALRTRQVGDQNYITYKGPKLDPTSKTRREIELRLQGGPEVSQQSNELFTALGFRLVAEVRKQRRCAHLKRQSRDIEIALDEVDGVGTYVELEIQAPQSELDSARSALEQLAAELGLKQTERRSYLELLLASREP